MKRLIAFPSLMIWMSLTSSFAMCAPPVPDSVIWETGIEFTQSYGKSVDAHEV
jgi:hypothetical protein